MTFWEVAAATVLSTSGVGVFIYITGKLVEEFHNG